MNYQKINVKEGINLHVIPTNKFKTNLLTIFLTLPLTRENVTKEALISAVLRRGSKQYPNSESLSIALEQMYGAAFDCGIEKMGDNHILKFYLETINEEFLPESEEILKLALETLINITFDPLVENEAFKEEYVKMEKENLKHIIKAKRDNKARYAFERCIEEMYKNQPYGLYKFGYIEDLEKIDAKSLYKYYKEMVQKAKIDIFVSGKVDTQQLKNIVNNNEQIKQLNNRKGEVTTSEFLEEVTKPNEIIEQMDITQGKLVMGLKVEKEEPEDKYSILLYNTILGGGANSKLFQNVREKASLAYTASSNYIKQKNNIFIRLRN